MEFIITFKIVQSFLFQFKQMIKVGNVFLFPTLTFIIQIAIFYMRTEKKFERERKMTEIRGRD